MERQHESCSIRSRTENAQIGEFAVKLHEQDHRFALDNRRPVEGLMQLNYVHGQAEVIIRIENLRETGAEYKMFFIGRKKGSSVYKAIGEFVPESNGISELRIALNPSDVDGQGTELSCFYIFLLAASGTPLQPVLKGDRVEPDTVAVKSVDENTKEKEVHKTYNSYYSEYIRQKTAELLDNADRYTHISPFDDVWLADVWRRVTDAVELPVVSLGAQAQIRKYGHFIYASAGKYFFVGIPGRHTRNEWPDAGTSGFLLWQPIKNSREYGYWCMVIDWKTGIITEIS